MLFSIHKSLSVLTNLAEPLLWRRQSNSLSKGYFLWVSVLYWSKSPLKILSFVHDKIEFIAKATPVPCKTNLVSSSVHVYKMCISLSDKRMCARISIILSPKLWNGMKSVEAGIWEYSSPRRFSVGQACIHSLNFILKTFEIKGNLS